MISLIDDVVSKKPHLRRAGGVWSCTSYRRAPGAAYGCIFRIGFGYSVREAFNDWKKQEFA